MSATPLSVLWSLLVRLSIVLHLDANCQVQSGSTRHNHCDILLTNSYARLDVTAIHAGPNPVPAPFCRGSFPPIQTHIHESAKPSMIQRKKAFGYNQHTLSRTHPDQLLNFNKLSGQEIRQPHSIVPLVEPYASCVSIVLDFSEARVFLPCGAQLVEDRSIVIPSNRHHAILIPLLCVDALSRASCPQSALTSIPGSRIVENTTVECQGSLRFPGSRGAWSRGHASIGIRKTRCLSV